MRARARGHFSRSHSLLLLSLSPLPTFSGADGFATRFGITYVDYKDGQKRYPKDSFRFLSKLWGGNGGVGLPAKYTPGGADADKENVAPEAPKTP